jgi:hypothetical protein
MRKYRIYQIFTGSLVARLSWRDAVREFGNRPDCIAVLYPLLWGKPRVRSQVTGRWQRNSEYCYKQLVAFQNENSRSVEQGANLTK